MGLGKWCGGGGAEGRGRVCVSWMLGIERRNGWLSSGIHKSRNPGCGKRGREEYMCVWRRGRAEWGGQSPLKGGAPPLRQDNPLPRLSSPPLTWERRQQLLIPVPLRSPHTVRNIRDLRDRRYTNTHTLWTRTLTHTHTDTHRPERHSVSTSTQRARTRRAPPRAASAPSTPRPSLGSPAPPSTSSGLRLLSPSAHASQGSHGPGDLKGRRGHRRKKRELEGGRVRDPASCPEVRGPNSGTPRGEGWAV